MVLNIIKIAHFLKWMLTTILKKLFNTFHLYIWQLWLPDLSLKASLFFPLQKKTGVFSPVNDWSIYLEAYFNKIQYGVRLEHSSKYSFVYVYFPFIGLQVVIAG